jgi:hypothetical protein
VTGPDIRAPQLGHGATRERLPVWVGGLLALAVTLAGSLPSIALAVYGDGLVWVYAGLAGIIASGAAGIALAYRFPTAALAGPCSGRRR